jgi:hypothetical protein
MVHQLSTIPRLFLTLGCLAALAACAATRAANGTAVNASAAMISADIDRLTGAPWKGTLTYLDYTSHLETTIKSSLLVTRLPQQPGGTSAWDMRVGYADEPHANSGETAVLTRDGHVFRDGEVLDRAVLADGSVRIVTEQDGQDDNRLARFRFVYLLGDKECSIQKLVRFAPEEAFFERHIYRWSR